MPVVAQYEARPAVLSWANSGQVNSIVYLRTKVRFSKRSSWLFRMARVPYNSPLGGFSVDMFYTFEKIGKPREALAFHLSLSSL